MGYPVLVVDRETYRRGEIECLLDRCRGYLVIASPEEHVRQDTLDWLIDELGVPPQLIRSEFNQRRRGGNGRADIIVLAPEADDADGRVLLVVECKRRGTFLDDRTWEQAAGYAAALDADYIVLTNGDERRVAYRANGEWYWAVELAAWNDLVEGASLSPAVEVQFQRWRWHEIATPHSARRALAADGLDWVIGEDSADHLAPFAVNLFGLLGDDRAGPDVPFWSGGILIEQDLGRRARTFGNAAGGTWAGEFYRSFLVLDSSTQAYQVVSLAVMGSLKAHNDPRWGNARSRTYLLVAVDDGPSSHLSLQMVLDETATPEEFEAGWAPMRHKGRLTAGKRGAVKRAEILVEVGRVAPDLVSSPYIWLGTLPTQIELSWEHARDFVGNVIRYALIRDRIRAKLRQ